MWEGDITAVDLSRGGYPTCIHFYQFFIYQYQNGRYFVNLLSIKQNFKFVEVTRLKTYMYL